MEASEERQVILQLPPNTKFPKSRIASELELTQNATLSLDLLNTQQAALLGFQTFAYQTCAYQTLAY